MYYTNCIFGSFLCDNGIGFHKWQSNILWSVSHVFIRPSQARDVLMDPKWIINSISLWENPVKEINTHSTSGCRSVSGFGTSDPSRSRCLSQALAYCKNPLSPFHRQADIEKQTLCWQTSSYNMTLSCTVKLREHHIVYYAMTNIFHRSSIVVLHLLSYVPLVRGTCYVLSLPSYVIAREIRNLVFGISSRPLGVALIL